MRTLILVAALCASAHAKDTPLPVPDFPDERDERAREAFNNGLELLILLHFEQAIEVWEEGFRGKPNPEFLYFIGEAHRQRMHPWRAIESYRQYLQLAPMAKNRAEVKKKIRDLEKFIRELAPRAKNRAEVRKKIAALEKATAPK